MFRDRYILWILVCVTILAVYETTRQFLYPEKARYFVLLKAMLPTLKCLQIKNMKILEATNYLVYIFENLKEVEVKRDFNATGTWPISATDAR